MTVFVVGPRDNTPKNALVVNTTSRSTNWSKGLSPFILGPVDLYGGYVAQNVENAWQYSKVYPLYVDVDGTPSPQYFEWAKEGWANPRAVRYPMGKGAVPEYSWWDGEKYDYVEARKKIYIPLYAKAVYKSSAFWQVKELADKRDIYLWDFDGYNHHEERMTLKQVVNCPTKKMGHAFVIAMLLEGMQKKNR